MNGPPPPLDQPWSVEVPGFWLPGFIAMLIGMAAFAAILASMVYDLAAMSARQERARQESRP